MPHRFGVSFCATLVLALAIVAHAQVVVISLPPKVAFVNAQVDIQSNSACLEPANSAPFHDPGSLAHF